MDPITSSETFQQDPNLSVTENADGSATVDMPVEEEADTSDHFSNLAETLDDFTLNKLSSDILEMIEKDKEARKQRDKQYEIGIQRTGLGDDAPGGAQFEGASRAVHPILAEGCVDFAARAIKELMPANGPVKTKIQGDKADRKALERAQRKRDYLNFLITKRMRSFRDEKEVLLTQLPLGGSQYEKYLVDPKKKTYTMEFVPIDKVLLPFAATSFYSSPRATHMVDLTRSQFEKRVKDGFYRDISGIVTESYPEETAAEKANDKIEGVEENNYNVDGLRLVYETIIERAIEDEEEARPYVVHTDEPTGKILAVYRNWSEGDESYTRLDWWVEDKFIPWRGVYGIGLPHLIGGLSSALTGALRALLDSAHINNSPGAIKLKGGRASGQNIIIEQTQVQEIEAPAGVDDIRKVMMPLPFNPPSAVLFQLLDWITAQAKGVVATAEEKIADASNSMPVGTALALIEQGSQVFSSIHARLHESQRRSFEILCRLIQDYPNEEDLARFDLTPQDFSDNDDIQPVSDPNIFSESQRYAQLQEQLKVMATFPDLKWNRDEFARRALQLLRTDAVDSLLPKPPEDVTADPVTENMMAVTTGAKLVATQQQDHVAHMREHIRFILDPLLGSGPAVTGDQLQGILAHCQQHLLIMYDIAAKTAARINVIGTGQSEEMAMAEGAEYASKAMSEAASQLAPALAQAAKVVQSKMPQPPQDPAVEKTFQAAMANVQRQQQADQANNQLQMQKMQMDAQAQQQKMQIDAQLQQQKLQFDQAALQQENAAKANQQQFDQRIAQMAEVFKLQMAQSAEQSAMEVEKLRAQITLMKNEQDNRQHADTELAKNTQDNQTAIIVAEMNKRMELQAQSLSMIEQAIQKMFGPSSENPPTKE